MTGLSACPICRSNLERFPDADRIALTSCPDCSTDLTQFLELKANGELYRNLAIEHLARHDYSTANTIVESLSRLVSEDELPLSDIRFRLALANGDLDGARDQLQGVAEPERKVLEQQLATARESHRLAIEQYNYSLTCARDESFQLAQSHIRQAAELAPREARIWVLKLKIDLKVGSYAACYEDLAQLDLLDSRPLEYNRLESLLPPL